MFKLWYTSWYPELYVCPTEAERVAVLKDCSRRAQTKRVLRQLFVSLPLMMIASIALVWFWTERFGNLPPKIAVVAAFGMSFGMGGLVSFRWSERHLAKVIRRELVDRGYPLCLHCGYNLTGNTSGVCPECGTPAAAAAEKPGR